MLQTSKTALSRVRTKSHHPLHDGISGIVGGKYVTDDDFALVPYGRDISAFPESIPGIVVRPGSTEEISEIVKLANRTGYPIVLKGGGQAAGGVTKGEPSRHILIDMGRIDHIEVDMENQTLTCGGGARCSTLDDALRPYGYTANTVIGPYYTATMGGLVGGIAGGGVPRNTTSTGDNWLHICGLKVVLPTGEIITTGAGHDTNVNRKKIQFRECTAPDLTGLFIASGGVFGIITEITQVIYPLAKFSKSISYIVDTMENAWKIQKECCEMVTIPYSNMMFFEMANYMVKSLAGEITGYGALFYCVEGDSEAEVELKLKAIDEVCRKHGTVRGTPGLDNYAATGSTGNLAFVHDICSNACPFMTWESTIQRSDSMEYTAGIQKLFRSYEDNAKYHVAAGLYTVPKRNTILTGITIHWDTTIPGAEEHAAKVWKAGAEYMLKWGTSSTYAQGTNSNFISEAFSPAFSKVMTGLKKALDPNNIMCPGMWNL